MPKMDMREVPSALVGVFQSYIDNVNAFLGSIRTEQMEQRAILDAAQSRPLMSTPQWLTVFFVIGGGLWTLVGVVSSNTTKLESIGTNVMSVSKQFHTHESGEPDRIDARVQRWLDAMLKASGGQR